MNLGRREFLASAAAVAATLRSTSAIGEKAAADAVDGTGIVIDALGGIGNPNLAFNGIVDDQAPPGRWPEVDPRAIADAHQSGLTAVNLTLGHVFGEGDDIPFEHTVRSIASHDAMIRSHPHDFLKALTGKDILRSRASGKVGLIYGFQNTEMLGEDASRVGIFADLGVRVIQLTYNRRNRVGDGSMEKENRGLTDFGRDVLGQLNENRVLVDLSHSGEQLCLDALAQSRVPIAITHTGCAAVNPHPRNKSDRELKLLADSGGVAGIYFMPYLKTGSQPYADDVVRHIEHAVNVCGEDHVGIGSDGAIAGIDDMENFRAMLAADVERRKATGVAAPGESVDIVPFIPDMNGPEKYRILQQKLRARGYGSTRISKILGGNFLRLMTEVWPAPAT